MARLCFGPSTRSESRRKPGMYVPPMPIPSRAWKQIALANPRAKKANPALPAAAARLPAAYTFRPSPRSVSAVHDDTEATYPRKNMPPTVPACALVSDQPSRSCGSSAAKVANPSIEQTCAATRMATGCIAEGVPSRRERDLHTLLLARLPEMTKKRASRSDDVPGERPRARQIGDEHVPRRVGDGKGQARG